MIASPISRISRLVGLHRELPEQVIGERRRRGERVLDRRELLDLGRRARPVPVVEVVAEEILVVLVVPGVALFLRGLFFLLFLRRFDRLELFGRAPPRASGSRPSPG